MGELLHWQAWVLVAAIFALLELFSFTAFFFILSFAAIGTSIIAHHKPLLFLTELLVFMGFAFVGVALSLVFKKQRTQSTAQVNDIYPDLYHRTFTLRLEEEDGRFQERFGNEVWFVKGQALEAGDKVKVVDIQDKNLLVEKVL